MTRLLGNDSRFYRVKIACFDVDRTLKIILILKKNVFILVLCLTREVFTLKFG